VEAVMSTILKGSRLHIGFFGRCNAGRSRLFVSAAANIPVRL
jgi:hypothetical protein